MPAPQCRLARPAGHRAACLRTRQHPHCLSHLPFGYLLIIACSARAGKRAPSLVQTEFLDLAGDGVAADAELLRRFESRLILTALANTRGRRIEAAQKLGIGRNTITRKIQELGLE